MPTTADVVRETTFIESPRLSERMGASIVLASETFQFTGSFKFRAAYHLAANVSQVKILTASSGNFGQALAYACKLLGKQSIVVMPQASAKVKIDAVRGYGGVVDLVDTAVKHRAERVRELAALHPDAYVASAYDDPLVIAGNATLGEEIGRAPYAFDTVVAPVGGGGLTSGIAIGLVRAHRKVALVGAEPKLGNDAARSLAAGVIVANEKEPLTIADGARTVSLGQHNFPILQRALSGIVEVPEEAIEEGVRLLFSLANLKVEPTGALSLGALLADPGKFRGQSVCCVVSGANVDPELYRKLLASL